MKYYKESINDNRICINENDKGINENHIFIIENHKCNKENDNFNPAILVRLNANKSIILLR